MSICDEVLFKNLFQRHHRAVERFVISRGAIGSESLDIVQESFLRLWKKCKEVSESKVKSFLFTTSSRILIDEYRKRQTRQKYQVTLDWKSNSEDAQYQLEMSEFKEKLEDVISSMSPTAREVFLMHRFESMKYKEIAQHIGISIKAVEKRMHKALLHLSNNKIPKIP